MDDNRALSRQLALLLGVFFLLGLGLFSLALHDLLRHSDIETWRTIDAEVVDTIVAEVDNPDYITYRDSNGNTRAVDPSVRRRIHTITLSYQFEVQGDTYTGTGVWGKGYASRGEAEQTSPPRSLKVFYRPQTPQLNSTIPPGETRNSAAFATIAGLVLMAVTCSIGILWYRISHSDWEPTFSKRTQLSDFEISEEPRPTED